MTEQSHDQALAERPPTFTEWASGHKRFAERLGVLKVNLVVADIDRAVAFYDQVFALREVMRILEGGLVEVLVGDGQSTSIALVQLPHAAPVSQGPSMGALGVSAPFPLVTIVVPDLQAACDRLVAAGGQVLFPPGPPVQVAPDQTARLGFCADLDGNSLELIELR